MATIDVEVALPASPEKVWDVFSSPDRFGEWLTIHDKWKGDVPATFAKGAQMSQVVSMLGMPNTITWTVDEVTEPERLVMSGEGMASVKAEFALGVRSDGNGGSLASIQSSFEGSLVKGALAKAIMKESRNQLDESLARLEALLKAES